MKETGVLPIFVKNDAVTHVESEDNPPRNGLVTGRLVGFETGGCPLVVYSRQVGTAACLSRSIVEIGAKDIGANVALMFDEGDLSRPVIIGLYRQAVPPELASSPNVSVTADGRRLVVEAKEEIVLQCGKASITLTQAGKIIIRGKYLSSQSSGVNRIRGGSIQIN